MPPRPLDGKNEGSRNATWEKDWVSDAARKGIDRERHFDEGDQRICKAKERGESEKKQRGMTEQKFRVQLEARKRKKRERLKTDDKKRTDEKIYATEF